MDSGQVASAPPVDWTDGKASVCQAPPPPYQDSYPGYPQPGPGYPQPGPGYPQPGPGYPKPGPGYPQPGPGCPPQAQDYGSPPQYGYAGYGQQQYLMGQQYPGQPATVTVQPTVFVTRTPLANPVNDYMCYSIFMLFCCLPLGIAALIHSISTREANHNGNQTGAEQSSKMARLLNHVGLGLGITAILLSFFLRVFVS